MRFTKNYQVERIKKTYVDARGKIRYLIKWKGWSDADSTWEPEKNLESMKYHLIQYFKARLARQKSKPILRKKTNSTRSRQYQIDFEKQIKRLTASIKFKPIKKQKELKRIHSRSIKVLKESTPVKIEDISESELNQRKLQGKKQVVKKKEGKLFSHKRKTIDKRVKKERKEVNKINKCKIQQKKKRGRKPYPLEVRRKRVQLRYKRRALKEKLNRLMSKKQHQSEQNARKQQQQIEDNLVKVEEDYQQIYVKFIEGAIAQLPQTEPATLPALPIPEKKVKIKTKRKSFSTTFLKSSRKKRISRKSDARFPKQTKFHPATNKAQVKVLESRHEKKSQIEQFLLTKANISQAVPIYREGQTHFQIPCQDGNKKVTLSTSEIVKVNPNWVIDYYMGFLL